MSEQRRKHYLIAPLFVPNQGCPQRCVYCSQGLVTGREEKALTGPEVTGLLSSAAASPRFKKASGAEIAFYGGTFTGLSLEKMEELLEAANAFVGEGGFDSIRVSTRPDALDRKRLDLMRSLGVRTVELGVQSMDDEVLSKSRRGYKAADVHRAVGLLKREGFRIGIQLMPGLPGDSEQRFRETVTAVRSIRPDVVRLYPTVVFRGTRLSSWYAEGRYRPLTLEEAVKWCAEGCSLLESEGIPVIRIGLMITGSDDPAGDILAGPWHPALGFLVRSKIYRDRIARMLPPPGLSSAIEVLVHPSEVPLARGYRNQGLAELRSKAGSGRLEIIPDPVRVKGEPMVQLAATSGG